MQKIIKIGEREVALRPSASTPYRYEQVFNENFFDAVEAISEDGTASKATDAVFKLAYVLAMQGERADTGSLNRETFINWLDGFEFADLIEAAADIIEAYTSSAKGTINPK